MEVSAQMKEPHRTVRSIALSWTAGKFSINVAIRSVP